MVGAWCLVIPIQVQVSQTPLAFLDIGLQEVHGVPEFLVLPLPLLDLGHNELVRPPRHDAARVATLEFLEQVRAARQVSGFHQRGAGRDIGRP